jgi:hypothetical protein
MHPLRCGGVADLSHWPRCGTAHPIGHPRPTRSPQPPQPLRGPGLRPPGPPRLLHQPAQPHLLRRAQLHLRHRAQPHPGHRAQRRQRSARQQRPRPQRRTTPTVRTPGRRASHHCCAASPATAPSLTGTATAWPASSRPGPRRHRSPRRRASLFHRAGRHRTTTTAPMHGTPVRLRCIVGNRATVPASTATATASPANSRRTDHARRPALHLAGPTSADRRAGVAGGPPLASRRSVGRLRGRITAA